jgi:hypothetical protein
MRYGVWYCIKCINAGAHNVSDRDMSLWLKDRTFDLILKRWDAKHDVMIFRRITNVTPEYVYKDGLTWYESVDPSMEKVVAIMCPIAPDVAYRDRLEGWMKDPLNEQT